MATPIDLHEVAKRQLESRSRYPWRIKVCTSTACESAGAGAAVWAAFGRDWIRTSATALASRMKAMGSSIFRVLAISCQPILTRRHCDS